MRKYIIGLMALSLLLIILFIIKVDSNNKNFYVVDKEIKEYGLDSKKVIYSKNNYYTVENNSLIESKYGDKQISLIINSTVVDENDNIKLIISYEWIKKVKIKSFIVSVNFLVEPTDMKIDILRNRFERNRINDKWMPKEVIQNRSYDMNWNRGYIWTNIDGEINLYNKKDIFNILLNKDMIDKFNILFAYSKNKNINITYNENNSEISFEGNKHISYVKIDNTKYIEK